MSNQSLLSAIPENSNFIQSAKYTFVMPNLPFANYFCQTVSFPGVSTSPIPVENPFSATYRHGDKMVYDNLTITALIDEDFRVWEETYNWLLGLTFPHKYGEYIKNRVKDPQPYYDGILTLNKNSNNPNLRVKFENCFPITLGGVQFAATDTADTILVADITFQYDTFRFDRL